MVTLSVSILCTSTRYADLSTSTFPFVTSTGYLTTSTRPATVTRHSSKIGAVTRRGTDNQTAFVEDGLARSITKSLGTCRISVDAHCVTTLFFSKNRPHVTTPANSTESLTRLFVFRATRPIGRPVASTTLLHGAVPSRPSSVLMLSRTRSTSTTGSVGAAVRRSAQPEASSSYIFSTTGPTPYSGTS